METKTQNEKPSGWKAAGKAASFVFLPRWFFSDVSIAVAATRGLGRGILGVLSGGHHETTLVGEGWNENVLAHHMTVKDIKSQVSARQRLAYLYFAMAVGSLAAGVLYAWLGYLIFLMFAAWYLRHTLTLFQIREHRLCKISTYLKICTAKPENLLPLGLPNNWSLLSQDVGNKS